MISAIIHWTGRTKNWTNACVARGCLLSMLLAVVACGSAQAAVGPGKAIPVIFDTDICDDIDDTWALALLLRSPELDLKLVTTAVGNTEAKAKVVAKFLQAVGRADIPVGIGVVQSQGSHRQTGWAAGYDLSSYPGHVHRDGVQALVDTVMKSPDRITIIAVGPLPNIAAALQREPRIADKADFVGMHGSIRRGYSSPNKPEPEYNVKADVKAAQAVFTAPWTMTITPLDTCGLVQLEGQNYQKVLLKQDPLTRTLIDNYRAWLRQGLRDEHKDMNEPSSSAASPRRSTPAARPCSTRSPCIWPSGRIGSPWRPSRFGSPRTGPPRSSPVPSRSAVPWPGRTVTPTRTGWPLA